MENQTAHDDDEYAILDQQYPKYEVDIQAPIDLPAAPGLRKDIDLVRVVISLSKEFYERVDPNSFVENEPGHENDEAEETEDPVKKQELRYHNLSKYIITDDFQKLVGTSSHTLGYGPANGVHGVKRKFSVVKHEWETKFPYCPKHMAGK